MVGLLAVAQAFGGLTAPAFAADKPPVAAAAKPPAAAAKPPTMPAAPSSMTQAAAKAGVLTCAARIDQLSKYLGGAGNVSGVTYMFLMQPTPPPRDQRMAASAMEVDSKDSLPSYASAEFAASGQGCDVSYQVVTYWPLKCDDVFTKYYSKVRQAPALGKSIATLDTGGNTRIFLMPAGEAGCVTIKKELL